MLSIDRTSFKLRSIGWVSRPEFQREILEFHRIKTHLPCAKRLRTLCSRSLKVVFCSTKFPTETLICLLNIYAALLKLIFQLFIYSIYTQPFSLVENSVSCFVVPLRRRVKLNKSWEMGSGPHLGLYLLWKVLSLTLELSFSRCGHPLKMPTSALGSKLSWLDLEVHAILDYGVHLLH